MEFKIFQNYPQFKYGMSEQADGSMRVNDEESNENVIALQNRQAFFVRKGINKIFFPKLTHGSNVVIVSESDIGRIIEADAAITNRKNIFLAVTVADCFPVFLFNPKNNVVGLVHAGWRGVVSNIIKNTIEIMIKRLNSDPGDILAAIGPGIQKCHFTKGEDKIDKFRGYDGFIEKRTDGVYAIDLEGIIKKQLQNCGVINIESSGLCTYELPEKYFSWRRDRPEILQTMVCYIGLI